MNVWHTWGESNVGGRRVMYRKQLENLALWKNSPYRKPLIVQGARQVGKTYTLLEFGRVY